MVYEDGIPVFSEWLASSALTFLLVAAVGAFLGILIGFLVSAAQHGPSEGFNRTFKVLFSAFTSDFPGFSVRRTWAIAWLAVQESIRNRVLLSVFSVFVLILLFAGWFLDPRADDPARLYLTFVLNTCSILVLVMSVFLSTLSLPNDMKNKTIYTVVTKPVRASEIVLGRVVGFTAVGTALLAVMMVLSFGFVTRGLDHSHAIVASDEEPVYSTGANPEILGYQGITVLGGGHRHEFRVDASGQGATELAHGHRHEVTRTVGSDGKAIYTVGPATEQLVARVPIYGKLHWLDNQGKPTTGGINVGNEWTYRQYIAGGTNAAAVWTFSGLSREQFPPDADDRTIPLELNIRIFRTYKGDITKGVLGSLTFRNPNPASNVQSAPIYQPFKEFETDTFKIPLKLKRLPDDRALAGGRDVQLTEELDLFDDLVHNGQLEVILKCEEPAQYYGVAAPDIYIRAGDRPFWANFIKSFLTMWLQMLVVVSFGVMFSTFLSGPVAFLATTGSMVIGFFIKFVREVATSMFVGGGEYEGGGTIESFIRMVTQQNITTEFDAGPTTTMVVQTIDRGLAIMLYAATFIVPDFRDFNKINYVAYGYNIDAVLLSTLILQAFVYTAGTTLVGYFILKTREIAQ
jgi:hypothetical protein